MRWVGSIWEVIWASIGIFPVSRLTLFELCSPFGDPNTTKNGTFRKRPFLNVILSCSVGVGAGRPVDPPTWAGIGGHRSVNEMSSQMSPLVLPPRGPFSKMNMASVAQIRPEVPINSPIGAPFRGGRDICMYVGLTNGSNNTILGYNCSLAIAMSA